MNGCDTFAYVDDTLAAAPAPPLNPDDPTGTQYMDIVTNAMPAFFHVDDRHVDGDHRAAVRARPRRRPTRRSSTNMDRVAGRAGDRRGGQRLLSTYDPGVTWNGFEERGAVEQGADQSATSPRRCPPANTSSPRPPTPRPPAATPICASASAPRPTLTATYKCPSYQYNSNEKCTVTLTAPAKVYLAVTGDATAQSRFIVDGFKTLRQRLSRFPSPARLPVHETNRMADRPPPRGDGGA